MNLSIPVNGSEDHLEVTVPRENITATSAWICLTKFGCYLTVAHTPGRLSYFSLMHDGCEFDFEIFNNERTVIPFYLQALLHRFTPERFRRWKKNLVVA